MSTLADELLNDFEDSGSEGEEQQNGGLFSEGDASEGLLNGHNAKIRSTDNGDMDLDGDEEAVDEDEEMMGMNDNALDQLDDEDEAKAKVEKMQLGGVDDVRSVAGLMKTLEPVLEVSTFLPLLNVVLEACVYIYFVVHSPDILRRAVENCTFPVFAARKANDSRWID